MDAQTAFYRLSSHLEVFIALTRQISEEQAHWKPAPETWSMVEVFAHLYDEEREDFRQRVRLTLESPAVDWPPIHPQAWVTERAYNQRALLTALNDFMRERHASLAWLRSLSNPKWDAMHTHPQFGSATAAEMLDAWVAHDYLHIRQLNELHWQWHARTAAGDALAYAGGW